MCVCMCMQGLSIISVGEEIEEGYRNLSCSVFPRPGPHHPVCNTFSSSSPSNKDIFKCVYVWLCLVLGYS